MFIGQWEETFITWLLMAFLLDRRHHAWLGNYEKVWTQTTLTLVNKTKHCPDFRLAPVPSSLHLWRLDLSASWASPEISDPVFGPIVMIWFASVLISLLYKNKTAKKKKNIPVFGVHLRPLMAVPSSFPLYHLSNVLYTAGNPHGGTVSLAFDHARAQAVKVCWYQV